MSEHKPPTALNEPISWDDPARVMRQMNHDLRTPLNVIIATTTMFSSNGYGEMNPAQQKAMARIQRNSHRMMALMDDLSMYVKVVTGELLLTPKPMQPSTALENWLKEVREKFPAEHLTWELRLNPMPPVLADEEVLKQAVLAVVWNAIAFTETGTITVTSDWQDQQWVIQVQDTGMGITEEEAPRIFDLFWRGMNRPQMQGVVGGFGLGLPMTKAVIALLGGTVTLEQSSPTGSTFMLKIPLPGVE